MLWNLELFFCFCFFFLSCNVSLEIFVSSTGFWKCPTKYNDRKIFWSSAVHNTSLSTNGDRDSKESIQQIHRYFYRSQWEWADSSKQVRNTRKCLSTRICSCSTSLFLPLFSAASSWSSYTGAAVPGPPLYPPSSFLRKTCFSTRWEANLFSGHMKFFLEYFLLIFWFSFSLYFSKTELFIAQTRQSFWFFTNLSSRKNNLPLNV